MLRIVTEPAGNGVTMKLEGRLIGPWVEELRRCSERSLAAGTPLLLDASQLSFADHDGVRLLADLVRRGASLGHCSPFVREQLRAATSARPVTTPARPDAVCDPVQGGMGPCGRKPS